MKKNANFYNDEFYNEQSSDSYKSAKIVLAKVLESLPEINSAVDFGCGVGTWLSAIKEAGVNEIQGYDGDWVEEKMLQIPPECFTAAELSKGITVNKKYDLAMSLEVAEHLPAESADLFVKSLTKASDIVLFSAAIPFQGGTNHINEQWPTYWNALFNKNGYVAMDFLRQQIWNEKDVCVWYKQNIMIFINTGTARHGTARHGTARHGVEDIEIKVPYVGNSLPLDIVHPDMYLNKVKIADHKIVKLIKKIIPKSIKSKIQKKL